MPLFPASLIVGVLLAEPAALPSGIEGEVVCTGPLPFSAEEVQEALLPRWHLLGGGTVVGVLVAILALDLAQDGGSFPWLRAGLSWETAL